MRWHVDNKFDDSVQSDYPGIIFIFYLNDVEDGELQLISGSNKWSIESKKADFSEKFIDEHYSRDIISLKMPAGSGLIYDTTIVHRAHKIRKNGFERKSLFFRLSERWVVASPF